MAKYVLILLLLLSAIQSFCQVDNVGAGRAISFDGVDDYIDFGNIYDDVALPITVSFWAYIDPSITALVPIFDNQDGSSVYNGFAVVASHVHVGMTYGDGKGGNNPAFRRSKAALMSDPTGKWINVTVVFRGATNMDIYLNGINAGGDYEGYSNDPMNSNSPGEVAKMGYWFSNGNYFRYKGQLDEFRIWNRALSESEIRETMCKKLKGNETGLIGYWNFDETSGNIVADKSVKGFNGTLMGNPQRVYSSAPIGDESVYLYPASWGGNTVSLVNGLDKLTVSNVQGTPEGVHVYTVNDIPSQTNGLNLAEVEKPYMGTFAAAFDVNNVMDLNYQYDGVSICKNFQRNNNSVDVWAEQPLTSILNRTEIVKIPASNADFDLGPDIEVCDQKAITLSAPASVSGKSLLWSTGQTSASIVVSTSGNYWLRAGGTCSKGRDTISVAYLKPPPPFSLGDDETLCILTPRKLSPLKNPEGYQFVWQDGSTDSTFVTNTFGEYAVTVSNACGTSSDKITLTPVLFDKNKIPNIITPGNDLLNEHFMIEESLFGARFSVYNRWGEQVYDNPNYRNDWNGAGLTNGIYFYLLTGDCIGKIKGSVTLIKGN
ncbi:gliding motility-associated C-terminal domain-containing protein [Chryseolinea lacunae]|uniref:Gliding motility-associated C-terminal domain-containing protein n=1 Tax=Chryseolinea lacunae TaxID=2801331 RepID=A0ABS1KPF4_9BACT|nr:LamG-like jellyroll fold domain-containing protein [Chryseolinea lacunae]MBL0741348.1 gliding motility-associated C-terminal domain-containing protein [Chryseolinea lacunae]